MSNVKVRVVTATVPTSGSTLDVTISGFGDVQSVLGISSYGSSNDTITSDLGVGFGFLGNRGSTETQVSTAIFSNDSSANTNCSRKHSNNNCLSLIDYSSLICELTFNSWITDGVRFNIATNPSTARIATFIFFGGSDVSSSYSGSISLGTGTSPIDVTDPGFQPNLVFFSGCGLSSTSVASFAVMSFGVAVDDGSDSASCINYGDQDALAISDIDGQIRNNLASTQTVFGSQTWGISVSDYDSQGFSVTPTASASSDVVFYLALKIDNSPDISLDFVDGPTSTGDWSTSSPGFEPNFGMVLLSDSTAYNSVTRNGVISVYSFDSTNEYTVSASGRDDVTTTVSKSLSSDVMHDMTEAGVNLHVGSFSSFNNDGLTLNFTTVPGSARKWALLTIGQGNSSIPYRSSPYKSLINR